MKYFADLFFYSTTTESTTNNVGEEEANGDEIEEDGPADFLPIIDMVQDTLLTKENRDIDKKMLFLNNLRDNLLINIG